MLATLLGTQRDLVLVSCWFHLETQLVVCIPTTSMRCEYHMCTVCCGCYSMFLWWTGVARVEWTSWSRVIQECLLTGSQVLQKKCGFFFPVSHFSHSCVLRIPRGNYYKLHNVGKSMVRLAYSRTSDFDLDPAENDPGFRPAAITAATEWSHLLMSLLFFSLSSFVLCYLTRSWKAFQHCSARHIIQLMYNLESS